MSEINQTKYRMLYNNEQLFIINVKQYSHPINSMLVTTDSNNTARKVHHICSIQIRATVCCEKVERCIYHHLVFDYGNPEVIINTMESLK